MREVRRRLSVEERRLADRRAERREWTEIAAEVGGSPEALRKQLARRSTAFPINSGWTSGAMDERRVGAATVQEAWAGGDSSRREVDALLDYQSGCWGRGERPSVESCLDRRPGLREAPTPPST